MPGTAPTQAPPSILRLAAMALALCLSLVLGAGSAQAAGRVVVIPVKGTVDAAMQARVVESLIAAAKAPAAVAVVLLLETKKARLVSVEAIIGAMDTSPVPVYAYVMGDNRDVGALLALAATEVFMTPGGSIGPATPLLDPAIDMPESLQVELAAKQIAYCADLAQRLAERHGHRVDLARALVDPALALNIGGDTLSTVGMPLRLQADAAVRVPSGDKRPVLARAQVRSAAELLVKIGLGGATLERLGDPEDATATAATAADGSTSPAAADGSAPAAADGDAPGKPASTPVASKAGDKVLILPIKDAIMPKIMFPIRRAFRQVADDESYTAVVIDMDTPGGQIDIMLEIVGLIRECRVPVYTYVNPDAISAGAMISLGTKAIYMAPGGRIGDAMPIMIGQDGMPVALEGPIREKQFSYIRALLRSLCEENGHDPGLALAMMDPDLEYIVGDEVVCPKGELLTLTAQEATRIIAPKTTPLLALSIQPSLEDMLAAQGLANAEVVHLTLSQNEQIAYYLSFIAPILLIGFFLGIFIELHTPGFGAGGIIAILCLAVFMFAQYVGGYSGGLELVIVAAGILLLAVEIFLIPGFGVTGILGIAAIVVGLILAMIPHVGKLPEIEIDPGTYDPQLMLGYVGGAVIKFAVAMVVTLVGAGLLSRFLPSSRLFNHLILKKSGTAAEGYVGTDVLLHRQLIGQTGVAMTDLRPSGTMLLGDRRLDVVSDGSYVEKGARIVILEADGPRVTVGIAPEPRVESTDDASSARHDTGTGAGAAV